MVMLEVRSFVTAETGTQPQRFVVAEGDADAAQESGRWLAAARPAEVRP